MAADNFPLHEAQLIALFMEAIFYGVYLVSFAACMRALLFTEGTRPGINKTMLIIAILMGVFATLSLAFQLRHVMEAFLWYQGPGGALGEFEDISYWVNVIQTVLYVVQTLLGDLVLIYRCYVVYLRRWLVVAFPLLIWMATLVTCIIAIRITISLKVNANINEQELVPWLTSGLVLTMAQSVVTTPLIAYRIWKIQHRVSKIRSTSPGSLIKMIIESGAIYTVSVIIFLILYLCHHNAQYPVSVCIMQLIGIIFNSIIIRVHQGKTADQQPRSTTQGTSLNLGAIGTVVTSSSQRKVDPHSPTENYTMQPVQVNVQRHVVRDYDTNSTRTFGESKAHGVTDFSREEV